MQRIHVKKLLLFLIFLPSLLHSAAEQPTSKIVRANSTEIAAASYLQANKMRHQQTDLSCSCFGPKFYDIKCLPCLKSQPLPSHIQGRIINEIGEDDPLARMRYGTIYKLHYYDTIKNESLGRLDCTSDFFCCCPCFIKPKLPTNVEIRRTNCITKSYSVYDGNNSQLQPVTNSCALCMECCIRECCHAGSPDCDE
jgi:hypothetical protein